MIEFEMTGRVGRELRSDDVRIVAAKTLGLKGNAVINVIDPTKSFHTVAFGSWTPHPAFSIPSHMAMRPSCT